MTGKISIYQVLPRLFGNKEARPRPYGSIEENGVGKLDDFTMDILREIKDLGVTHIWYTGIIDHATGTDFPDKGATHREILKGEAGSPYAVRDYYDVAPSLATNLKEREQEYRDLISRTHTVGLKVIQDFIPNHVSRAYRSTKKPPYVRDFGADDQVERAFDKNNNFYYIPGSTLLLGENHSDPIRGAYMEYPAKATGNDVFSPYPSKDDWYETVKLNYGWDPYTWQEHYEEPVPNTWGKMLDILLYWASMGVDAFRCDMAGMVPVDFWRWVIRKVHSVHPNIDFIAELYEPLRYEEFVDAGFSYLYDKVGLYDTLVSILKGESEARTITETWNQTSDRLKSRMVHFIENHDEQRVASDFMAGDAEKAFPAMAVSALIDSSAILTYFGQELGERGMDEEGFSGRDGRTTIFDYWSVSSVRDWLNGESKDEALSLRSNYSDVLNLAIDDPIFSKGQFYDLMYTNLERINPAKEYTFLRAFNQNMALVLVNFSGEELTRDIFIPKHALDTLSVRNGMVGTYTDPFSGRVGAMELQGDHTYRITVPPNGVAVRKFNPVC